MDIINVQGSLGWANSDRWPAARFDAYGPGGRWGKTVTRAGLTTQGHHLADALVELGAGEGAVLLVVAVNRGPEQEATVGRLREALTAAIGD
jgi:hypothetical protein